jgi:hypothetical protein
MLVEKWMIIGFFRYALGRMTCIVDVTVDWLVHNWEVMDEDTRKIIEGELESAFEHDDLERVAHASGERNYKWFELGNDCDRKQWERVRNLYRGQK